MRKGLAVLIILSGVLVFSGVGDSFACGDKFLVAGRGVRYQQLHGAMAAAQILVFQNPGSPQGTPARDPELVAILESAGHIVKVVDELSDLYQELTNRSYDIVLTDLSEADLVAQQTETSESKPSVLPVIYNPSREEIKQVRKQYNNVLKRPSKQGYLLAVIEETMANRGGV